jgi:glycerate 2-kinase
MPRSPKELRADALRIWHAGLAAVQSDRLMHGSVRIEAGRLVLGKPGEEEDPIDLSSVRRIAVVGAGKAGTGMAAALEEILGPTLAEEKQLSGWLNVPADCVQKLSRIHLHAARRAGVNEPTAEGIAGTEEILRIARELGSDDLCIALISGGGSALMPSPIDGISLADKLAVTRFLSAAGADITELNTVRKQLSRIKGGGLARECNAGRLIALIISDVLGDPLELIASGPTVADPSTPQDALDLLHKFRAEEAGIAPLVFDVLRTRVGANDRPPWLYRRVTNLLIGNNETAVLAAKIEAEQLGYECYASSAAAPEGFAEAIGKKLASLCDLPVRDNYALDGRRGQCFIQGGECAVKLAAASERGLGGRNQQTVLASLIELQKRTAQNVVILSGGTDGEDGPTDAAGAFVDQAIIDEAKRHELNAADYLRRNDAYHFFAPIDALIKTGPTHTNVCDVRIVLVDHGTD